MTAAGRGTHRFERQRPLPRLDRSTLLDTARFVYECVCGLRLVRVYVAQLVRELDVLPALVFSLLALFVSLLDLVEPSFL